jgi:hypothetical protein
MEQAGKEIRILLQEKLDKIRQNKGLKLSDMNLTDEAGKTLSESQKSLLFSGKRQMGLWLIIQLAKVLNCRITLNPTSILVVDYPLIEKYFRIDKMTSEEFASILTEQESIGKFQIRCYQTNDAEE